MCLIWIDIVPFFCDVTVVAAAVSLASELSTFMVSANRSHSSIEELLKMDVDDQRDHAINNDEDDAAIQTSFSSKDSNVQSHNYNHYKHHHHHQHHHHRQNHHHNHAEKPHWHTHRTHHFSESDRHHHHQQQHQHHHETKYIDGLPSNEWLYSTWQSNDIQPKVRRRHEKRWHHQRLYRFNDHSDQTTSKLHADLEIRMLDAIANDTENVPIKWPVKKEAIMDGEVILGGLMMVHSRG